MTWPHLALRGVWIRHAISAIRWSRIVAYIAIAGSGVAAVVSPPASVAAAAHHGLVVYAWAILLALSSAACALGAVTDRWVGEYIGLVPLALSAAVFAFSSLARGAPGIAGGAFLFGFFWILASRWQEVALLRIESTRRARQITADAEGDQQR